MNGSITVDDVPVRIKNLGWRVTLAGLGINLALGVLYSWSVISGAIEEAGWGWTQTQRSLPYSVACLVFCLIMVPAGRMQDRLGPRLVASLGGILVGAGMILASFTTTPVGFVIGFGVLAGAGIGFGYASATPPAVKWFPPAKTGMITGIVVSGFGLASVYAAPLARWLSSAYSLEVMMMTLGIGFFLVVTSLAQLLKPPHRAFQLIEGLGQVGEVKRVLDARQTQSARDFTPREMLGSMSFYMLWFMYACGAGAGLMIISVAKEFGKAGAGVAAVVSLAIGNGIGRILAGMLSDRLGRKATMFLFFVLQAIMVVLLALAGREDSTLGSAGFLVIASAIVGANYGANLALFPSITKDFYGIKNLGMNYGLVFTAWGIGGFVLALFAANVYDRLQSFNFALYTSAALLIAAAVLTLAVKPPPERPSIPVNAPADNG